MSKSVKLTQWDSGDIVDIEVADILSVFVSMAPSTYKGSTIIILNQPNTFIIVKESHKDVMSLIQNDHLAETYIVDDDPCICTLLFQGQAIKCYMSKIQTNNVWSWESDRVIRKFEIIEV